MEKSFRILGPLGALFAGLVLAALGSIPSQARNDPVFSFLAELRPRRPAPHELILVEFDDSARKEGGAWPWHGTTLAEVLLAASELDAERVLLAFPLDGSGGRTARIHDSSELQNAIEREFGLSRDNVRILFEAMRSGSVRPGESKRYAEELLRMLDASEEALLRYAAPSEDGFSILEAALTLHGSVWIGLAGEDLPKELVGAAAGRGFRLIQDPHAGLLSGVGFLPLPSGTQKPGKDGEPFPAGLELLKQRLDARARILEDGVLRLEGASIPRRMRGDLEIPISQGGILYYDALPAEGLRRLSLGALLRYRDLRKDLALALERLERGGYLLDTELMSHPWRELERAESELLLSPDPARRQELGEATERLLAYAASALEAGERMRAYTGALLSAGGLSAEESAGLTALSRAAERDFSAVRAASEKLETARRELREALGASIAIFCLSADDGRREAEFLAAGLSGSFLKTLPKRASLALGSLLSLLAVSVGIGFGAFPAFFAGLLLGLGGLALPSWYFLATGVYLGPASLFLGPLGAGTVYLLIARRGRKGQQGAPGPAPGP